MPRSIAEIRKANGGLENLTDEDILQSTFKQYKSYYPSLDAYAAEVGYGGAGRGLSGSRISAGVDQYQANLLGLGGAVARGVGAEGVAGAFDRRREANESAAAYAAQRARDLGGVEDWRDVTGVGSALNYVGGLGAQSLPYLGEAVVGGLTGGATLAGTAARMGLSRAAASTAGAVAAGYPSAVGDVLSAQREAGGELLGSAALGGIPYAALNALGIEGQLARGLRPLATGQGGVARRVATGAGTTAVGEGLGETGQELVNQYFGRMAVDPNETLFNEEANKRYLDSFVGGAALGGVFGGVGGIRGPRQPETERDLTTTEITPVPRTGLDTAALMGSPYAAANPLGGTYAGIPLVTPAILNQETDLTAPAATTAAGETKPTVPSIFSELDTALNKLGVKPTKNSRGIYEYMVAEGIDPASPEAEPVLNALANSKLGEARKAVGEIIRARSPRGTGVSTVQQPAGGLGVGGAVVQGAVGDAGSAAPVAGTMGGGAPAAGAPLQQTGILPSTAGQPSTPVTTTAPAAALGQPSTTGAPSGTQAPQTIEAAPQGQAAAPVQPAAPAVTEPDIVAQIFGDQDADIVRGFLMGKSSAELAAEAKANGIQGRGEQMIRNKIAGEMAVRNEWPKKIAAAKKKFGYTDEQIRQALEASIAPDADTRSEVEREMNLGRADLYGVRMSETEATEAGLEGSVKSAGAGSSAVQGFTKLQKEIDAMYKRLAAEKDPLVLAWVGNRLTVLQEKVEAFEDREQAKIRAAAGVEETDVGLDDVGEPKETRAKAKAEPKKVKAPAAPVVPVAALDADTKAATDQAKAKWQAANRDLTKLDVADLNLLRNNALRLRNTALADSIAEEIKAKGGETDAVQVESPAGVSVQPEAEAGQGVGRQVRRAKKPAAEGKAATPAVPAKVLTEAEQAAQAWDVVAADFPQAPKFADLTKAQQENFIEFGPGNWERGDVELELTKLARTAAPTQRAIGREPVTIDVESRIIEEIVAPQVAKLPAPQVTRLENHYNAKRDTPEFMAKVKADVVLYATKGAEAVAGAIRDIIKAIHTGVLSVAMIFNPVQVSQIEAFVMVPQETRTTTQEVLAELPSNVKGMSEAGKQAYATLIPALKDKVGDKLITIADKPSGNIYVFKPDGSLVIQKKSLFGLAKGDLYKGNQDNPKNRITPAGLFNLKVIDAKAGAAENRTAGEYDTGTVLVIDDPDAWITIMHSVWLKEKDGSARAAALKTEGAADSRYSFGCINVDKATYKNLMDNYAAQMDGSKLFVVPDNQADTKAFVTGQAGGDVLVREGVQPVTKTTTTPVQSATKTAGVDRTIAAREERAPAPTPARAQELFTRKSRRSVRTADQSGVEFESVEASLDDLSGYSEGIAAGIRSLRSSGMGNAVDAIDSWMVTFSPVSWDAIYTMIDGKRTIIYNGVILKDKVLTTTATLHEVGHGIDEVQGGAGKFSGGAEFRMSRVNGELMSMRPGTVADELLNHWEDSSETSALGGMLNYPLDMTDPENRSLTMQELREEVFAQVWAFSNMNGGMDYLRDNLPTTYAFMEKAHEQVKATNYQRAQGTQQGAQSGQVQTGQQNAQPAGAILRASRQAKQGLIDRNIAKLPKMSQQPVKRVTEALGDLGGKYLDYAVFTSDLVKRAQALGLGAAKTFSDRLAARNAKVSEEERKIEKIADRYALIEDANKGDGPGSVNEFLFESTRTGKWGYDTAKFKADPAMKAMFNKLGPKAQQFAKDVFAHGDAMLSSKKTIVLNAANSEYDAMIKAAQDLVNNTTDKKDLKKAKENLAELKAEKADTLKRFQTLFRIREGVPYAPIKRTGTYAVVAESAAFKAAKENKDAEAIKKMESDPNHYSVSFVDTKWTGRNLRDSLAEAYPNLDINIVKRAEAMDDFSKNALMPALTKMRSAVTSQNTREDGKIDPSAGKLLNIINQLYLEALAEGSARKSEMRRRGVAGEVDMLQSFTQQGRADANFMASVEFEPKIQDALQQMRNQSRTGDRERKSEIFDELTKRYAGTLDPQPSPFISGLTNMASKFFLASSPAYYLQNLTQPFMMSLPAMAGRHDYTKAGKALWDAYSELGPLFKDVKLFDQQFDFSKVPADVRTAINELVNQGKIDIGLATEINEYKVDADGKLSQFAQRLNKGMRMAVQKTEAVNRLSTAIAAYRLEFARTKDADKATQYAADILTDTHGDYTAFNAPRAFNTQWGKVALQFRKFQLIQIAFYAKLFRDLGRTPEERAVAMKTLAYSLSHTGVFAGLMGVPGYAAISFVLGLFGDEDEPFDLTAWSREQLGPEWADMIMRGAPTVVGMDLSGKIGAGNMLSILPFSNADLSTTSGQVEAFGAALGGASLGMATRVADGLILMSKGDYYKGLERVMPKGVSDALKSGRQATEGMTRRNGDVVLPESEIGAIETVLTGLGIPSVQQSVTYERQNRMRDITENFQDRTTRIKNDYAKAVRQKDTAAMQGAREAWTKLQQARQRNGLKPQPMSNLLKAPQEQAQREKRTIGGVQYREGQRQLAEDVAAN
jgi:hypothetical protein